MPTNLKIIATIIIIVALALLGWWYFGNLKLATDEAPVATTTESTAPALETINLSPDINAPTDTSDAALEQDLSAVDSQIKNLGTDNGDVGQSLKNQKELPIE